MQKLKRIRILIISDGTGKTAKDLLRATLTQFKNIDSLYTIKKKVLSKEQIDQIVLEAKIHYDMIVFTIVNKELRDYLKTQSLEKEIDSIDVMGPVLEKVTEIVEKEPDYQPGILRSVNDRYYDRISALEYTLKNDLNTDLEVLNEADIILVGISRTSKTPLAIFLSLEGLKVVNVALDMDQEIDPKLLEVDQKKIIGLTIKPEALEVIRKNRVEKGLKVNKDRLYTNPDRINQEVSWAQSIFDENPIWPIFDITNTSIEEVCFEILKLIEMRRSNSLKQSKRFK